MTLADATITRNGAGAWVAVLVAILMTALLVWVVATHLADPPEINIQTPGASVQVGGGGVSISAQPQGE
jgi:hypothetical protein